jgi:hypothetical protein
LLSPRNKPQERAPAALFIGTEQSFNILVSKAHAGVLSTRAEWPMQPANCPWQSLASVMNMYRARVSNPRGVEEFDLRT